MSINILVLVIRQNSPEKIHAAMCQVAFELIEGYPYIEPTTLEVSREHPGAEYGPLLLDMDTLERVLELLREE